MKVLNVKTTNTTSNFSVEEINVESNVVTLQEKVYEA